MKSSSPEESQNPLGSPIPETQPVGPKPDAEGNVWTVYKPGREMNQRGQIRTTNHKA